MHWQTKRKKSEMMFASRWRIKGYTVSAVIELFYFALRTKMFWRPARLIRFPIQVRNSGKILGAKNFTTGKYCRIDVFAGGNLSIGENVQINDACHIACAQSIKILDNTLIASRVYITDHDHSLDDFHNINKLTKADVIIGRNCWIGENVSVLKGVRLGDNCVVGANSVVTKSFPSNKKVAGCPAKEIM